MGLHGLMGSALDTVTPKVYVKVRFIGADSHGITANGHPHHQGNTMCHPCPMKSPTNGLAMCIRRPHYHVVLYLIW